MTRNERQQVVASLLDELEEQRRRFYAARAAGAQPAALQPLILEEQALRGELAAAVALG